MTLNESLIQNGTVLLTNGSLNITVNVLAENLTGKFIEDSSLWSQVFPIITLIIGSLLTYIFNIFSESQHEKKEIDRYEYGLITDIMDIVNGENAEEKMTEYYSEERRKPIFIKIKNYRLIMEFMKKVIDEETPDTKDLKDIRETLKSKI